MKLHVDLNEEELNQVARMLAGQAQVLEDGDFDDPSDEIRVVVEQMEALAEWVEHARRQLSAVGIN